MNQDAYCQLPALINALLFTIMNSFELFRARFEDVCLQACAQESQIDAAASVLQRQALNYEANMQGMIHFNCQLLQ